jgi:hypothetical protein
MKAIMQLVRVAPSSASRKARTREHAGKPRQHERQEHTDHRRFRRRCEPAIDRADHAEDQQQHRDQPLERRDPVRASEIDGSGGGMRCLLIDRPHGDEAHEHNREHDPGYDARDEEPRDRLFGRGRIDDHDDRGRDQQTERAEPASVPMVMRSS